MDIVTFKKRTSLTLLISKKELRKQEDVYGWEIDETYIKIYLKVSLIPF